jgi:VIT1/CCC1 family predicted Fe2+/Mn2+ transporter
VTSAARALRVVGELRRRPLDPVDRFSEVIVGLIMVLAFTGSMSVAQGGQQGVREMLVAAIACNLAWGVVDGVMYVLTAIAGRSRIAAVYQGVRAAAPATARAIVMGSIPEGFAPLADGPTVDRVVERIRALPSSPRASVTLGDLRGALGSAVLVVLATVPPTIPFMLVEDPGRALRVSNAVALVCLFLAGYWLGRATGARAWLFGLAMVAVGTVLVMLTVALGG